MPRKTYFNWSSGKDSALALHYALKNPELSIEKLLTSINTKFQRVSMHGLPRAVLEAQSNAIGIPLDLLEVPEMPSMEDYNRLMEDKVSALKKEGYTDTVFGDIFLEDLKDYRDNMLNPLGIETHYPIWKKDTRELLLEFIESGFKALTVCINESLLDETFLGRELDESFLNDLPSNIDPCGENGEFHTFCYDGPIFKYQVPIKLGELVHRTYDDPSDEDQKVVFGFCDVLLT